MTLHVTFGVDPGMSGAIVTLLDGIPGPMLDMPRMPEDTKEVDAAALKWFIRKVGQENEGAHMEAVIERVRAMPNKQKGEERKMGAQSMFNFGDGFGQIKATFRCCVIKTTLVESLSWKRRMGLLGSEKDMARLLAIRRFPMASEQLKRKKDGGRADALLMALWHEGNRMF